MGLRASTSNIGNKGQVDLVQHLVPGGHLCNQVKRKAKKGEGKDLGQCQSLCPPWELSSPKR